MEKTGDRISEAIELYLKKDTRGTQIFLYGITGAGLLVALRRIRPFARFSKPSQVPDHFIKSKVRIRANVLRVEPSGEGPLLMVQTKPLMPLPRFGRIKPLPVKIEKVNVTTHGTSWLQTVTSGKEIVLVPVAKGKDSIECRVSMMDKSREGGLDIGKELVQLGFGMISGIDSKANLPKDKEVLTYRNTLLNAQKWAQRKRNGYWHDAIQPTLWWKLKDALFTKAESVLPRFIARWFNI